METLIMEKLWNKIIERMNLRNGELQMRDFTYIYGDDLVFIIIDKNGRYIGFDISSRFSDEKCLIAYCVADMIGSCGNTMIWKLRDEPKGTFKNEYGYTNLWKEL